MIDRPTDHNARPSADPAQPPQFRYVEEFVRYQLGQTLGGIRGMLEGAIPFIAFTIAWVIGRQLYPALGAAVGSALVLAVKAVLCILFYEHPESVREIGAEANCGPSDGGPTPHRPLPLLGSAP